MVSIQFTREAFREVQDAFTAVAKQNPAEFTRQVQQNDLKNYPNMWYFIATGMMGKIAKNHNPQLAETYLKFVTGGAKSSDLIGHETNGELKSFISQIHSIVESDKPITIETLLSWYSRGAEQYGTDPAAMRVITRVYQDVLAAVSERESIELNKNNSVPIKTVNELLTRNSVIVQKILANHAELLAEYSTQWSANMQEVLTNVVDQPEQPVKSKVVGKKKNGNDK